MKASPASGRGDPASSSRGTPVRAAAPLCPYPGRSQQATGRRRLIQILKECDIELPAPLGLPQQLPGLQFNVTQVVSRPPPRPKPADKVPTMPRKLYVKRCAGKAGRKLPPQSLVSDAAGPAPATHLRLNQVLMLHLAGEELTTERPAVNRGSDQTFEHPGGDEAEANGPLGHPPSGNTAPQPDNPRLGPGIAGSIAVPNIILHQTNFKPRFFIAKGGSTSRRSSAPTGSAVSGLHGPEASSSAAASDSVASKVGHKHSDTQWLCSLLSFGFYCCEWLMLEAADEFKSF